MAQTEPIFWVAPEVGYLESDDSLRKNGFVCACLVHSAVRFKLQELPPHLLACWQPDYCSNIVSVMDSDNEPFLYTGQLREIPQNVTHVTVHPCLKVIGEEAFHECSQLVNVELDEGLEQIHEVAFAECTSLVSIIIPSTVKEIGAGAFNGCSQLVNVELNEGLESIDKGHLKTAHRWNGSLSHPQSRRLVGMHSCAVNVC